MTISQIVNYLSLHPYFDTLNDSQKFIAISRAWNQIQTNKKQKVEIISFSLSDTTLPSLYVYKQPRLSLGLTELIDSYMSEDLFLKELTEEQRFMVYNIAQSKVERDHNILNHQHYKINTFKEDIIHRTPLTYEPALTLRNKLLEATIRMISLVIPASVTADILEITRKTINLIPGLNVVTSVLAEIVKTITLIPSLTVQASIYIAEALQRIITYEPIVNLTATIVSSLKTRNLTFIPSLTLSSRTLVDFDHEREKTYIPMLTFTATITR